MCIYIHTYYYRISITSLYIYTSYYTSYYRKLLIYLLVEHSSCTFNMKRINFNYSLKNIPVPSQKSYQLQLIDKTECFIKGMRWKAHLFQNNANNASRRTIKETYGFKSKHHPGQCKELETFEKDLYNIVSL